MAGLLESMANTVGEEEEGLSDEEKAERKRTCVYLHFYPLMAANSCSYHPVL